MTGISPTTFQRNLAIIEQASFSELKTYGVNDEGILTPIENGSDDINRKAWKVFRDTILQTFTELDSGNMPLNMYLSSGTTFFPVDPAEFNDKLKSGIQHDYEMHCPDNKKALPLYELSIFCSRIWSNASDKEIHPIQVKEGISTSAQLINMMVTARAYFYFDKQKDDKLEHSVLLTQDKNIILGCKKTPKAAHEEETPYLFLIDTDTPFPTHDKSGTLASVKLKENGFSIGIRPFP
jgi:hypothetical protein